MAKLALEVHVNGGEGSPVRGHFPLHADFCGLSGEVQVPRDEDRIESKTALTVHGRGDSAKARPFSDEHAFGGHQCGHGLEFCTAKAGLNMEVFAVQVVKKSEQSVVAKGAQSVRRVDAGEAVQGFDKEASVFHQKPVVGVRQVGFGLVELRTCDGFQFLGLRLNDAFDGEVDHLMAKGLQMVCGFGHLSLVSGQEVDAGHGGPTKRSTSMARQQADALPFCGRRMVAPVVLVAVGGALGAVLRWVLAPSPEAEGVPWGTLGVNLLGSLLLGVMTVLLAEAMLTREQALALGTGLLGAFTTMSTFAVEVVRMVDGGERILAVVYVLTTLVGCPLLAWCGWSMTEALTA